MNDKIDNYQYDASLEDLKLKSFMDNSDPMEMNMDLSAIKQKTYRKIYERRRRTKQRLRTFVAGAAACALVLIGLGLFYGSRVMSIINSQSETAQRMEQMQSIKVPTGQTMTILLSDGTKIVANSRTQVSYPRTFSGDTRDVQIMGEAFLEVAHDAEHPFIVHSGGFQLQVLGTKFNICNYRQSRSNVVLVEGSVEVTTQSSDKIVLKPSQMVDIRQGKIAELKHVNTSDYTSWINGVLNLNGDNLQSIVDRLNNFYGTNIVCPKNAPARLYGKLVLQPDIATTLQAINAIAGVELHER